MDKTKPQDEYASAFDEGVAIDEGNITEEQVAQEGLVPDEMEAEVTAQAEVPEGEEDEDGESEAEEAMEEASEGAEADPEATAEAAPAMADKEIQRLKSWEGRLKAREAELKAREVKLAQGGQAGESGDAAEAVEQVADAVASGTSMDEALAAIEADFGPEFVQALSTLVASQAARLVDEKVGAVNSDVTSLIEALKSDKQREHFEIIAEKHPDFMDVAGSADFQEWVKQKGEEAQNIVNVGSARQVCALLDAFKKGNAKGDPTEGAAVAVSSRAAGLRLPAKPASSDDYMSAWEEA